MNDHQQLPPVTPASLLAKEDRLARNADRLDGKLADRLLWAWVHPGRNNRAKRLIEETHVAGDIARVLLAMVSGDNTPLDQLQQLGHSGAERLVERVRGKVPEELQESVTHIARILFEEVDQYLKEIERTMS